LESRLREKNPLSRIAGIALRLWRRAAIKRGGEKETWDTQETTTGKRSDPCRAVNR
jgi:hypothetical protein